jgi:hypothetical protein
MFAKPFDQIAKEDIERLITDGIREGRQVDYKQKPPGGGDGERKEFAADATSFANAAGGYIIFGVTEQKDAAGKNTGLPASADGLANVNGDQEVLRLESMLRANVDPIIPGSRFRIIDGFPTGPVILLHIPRSWTAPHMVAVTSDSRFHTRGSAGKQSMDVREIRSAFVLSAEMPTLIRRFRDERLGRIEADETPVRLQHHGRIVLHMVPFSSVDPEATTIDLTAWAEDPTRLEPLYGGTGWAKRFNFDGLVTYCGPTKEVQWSYLQVFRSGAIESAMMLMEPHQDGNNYAHPWSVEKDVVAAVARYLRLLRSHGIDLPVVVAVSLLRVRGSVVPVPKLWDKPMTPLDRDALILPDVLVRDHGEDLPKVMRPAFDALWQAWGFPQSRCYGKDGKWNGGEHAYY